VTQVTDKASTEKDEDGSRTILGLVYIFGGILAFSIPLVISLGPSGLLIAAGILLYGIGWRYMPAD